MFGFDHEGGGNPMFEFASKLAAEQERRAREQARKEAELRQMPLPAKILAASGKVAKISGAITLDFLAAPIVLYLLYVALYRTGVYAIPPAPPIMAVILPYLMWRILATEVVAQLKKINRRR